MHKWRNTCPEGLSSKLNHAEETRFYLLRQMGPTGFIVKAPDVDIKYKVLLGSTHCCDCSDFMKEKELCIHILWILIRKFRLSKEDPTVFQLGLCERELNSILYGQRQQDVKKPAKATSAGGKESTLKPKVIEKGDVCPICQEEIYKTKKDLTFCKFGCGNSIHISCMKIWAEHQHKAVQEEVIKCPLCRTEFGNYNSILKEYRQSLTRRKVRKTPDTNYTCMKCRAKISWQDSVFRCSSCPSVHLCCECFSADSHVQHSFFEEKKGNGKWQKVERKQILALSIGGTNVLSDRISPGYHLKDDGVKGNTLKTRRPLQRGRSSSQTDLRDISLGINGLSFKNNASETQGNWLNGTNEPNIKSTHNKPKLRFPPLPKSKKGLIAVSPKDNTFSEQLTISATPIRNNALH